MEIKSFGDMTDKEKLSLINKELSDSIKFEKMAKGSGRMYDSSVRLTIEQVKWLINKVK